jgi:hypothetical protein
MVMGGTVAGIGAIAPMHRKSLLPRPVTLPRLRR